MGNSYCCLSYDDENTKHKARRPAKDGRICHNFFVNNSFFGTNETRASSQKVPKRNLSIDRQIESMTKIWGERELDISNSGSYRMQAKDKASSFAKISMLSDCHRITEEDEIESLRASDLEGFSGSSSEDSNMGEEDSPSSFSKRRRTEVPLIKMSRKHSKSFRGKMPG